MSDNPRPKLLDLFCGAGGAGAGYHRAGFEVTGVDLHPQPNYPFRFFQADALQYVSEHWQEYDAIHASPPCQRFTALNRIHRIAQSTASYADLVGETRAILRFIELPYVIENVPGAPLRNAITLCGASFGLSVYRHRLFESNVMVLAPHHKPHRDNTPPAGSGISSKGFVSITSGGVSNLPDGWTPAAYKNMAMAIDWMTQRELSEAIPPAYTEYIGRQLIQYVLARKAS